MKSISEFFRPRRRGQARAETKASATASLGSAGGSSALVLSSGPHWTPRGSERLLREGYRKNVIAYRSVRIVSECAASVPLVLMQGDERVARHGLWDLMTRPNPLQSGQELMEALYAYILIAGNAYLEAAEVSNGTPGELYALRPDRMHVVPGPNGWPVRYEYRLGGQTVRFPVDAARGISPILHLRAFNPLDDHYGQSALEAAAFSIDIHNAAQAWNKALLDNAARPSGALVFEPREGEAGELSQDQFERLKSELQDHYQGPGNAGRPFLLEGGLKWQQIAFSPQDMEFIQSKHVSAREIALAFGVPPMLLGIPGDNTYANYQEANRALWRLTILPLAEKVLAGLNAWLVPRFDADMRFAIDRDAIPALAGERAQLWQQVSQAGFLTRNEKRQALGFDPLPAGRGTQESTTDE